MRPSFLFGLLLFFGFPMHADQLVAVVGPRLITTDTPAKGTFEERAIEFTESISNKVSATGEAIDLILARKKFTDKRNDSHINLSQLVNWTEGGHVATSTDFGFNIALPNVEKRWQLRFSSYDEEQESRDLNQRTLRTQARPRDPGAALLFFKKLGNVKTSFQPRLELKSPLQVSYVFRLSSAADLKYVRLEPRVEFFADSIKGTGEYSEVRVVIRRSPTSRWEYALENDEEYREKLNFFSTHHGITTSYALSDTQGLSGAIIASSENHDFHLASLNISTGYGQQIYSELLRYGISPYIVFGKSDHFHGHVGISLSVEAIF